MASAVHSKSSFQKPPRRQVVACDNHGPSQRSEPNQGVSSDAPAQDGRACGVTHQASARGARWEEHAAPVMDTLPSGKQQLMEKFFSPGHRCQGSGGSAGARGPNRKYGEKDSHPPNRHLHHPHKTQHDPHLHRTQFHSQRQLHPQDQRREDKHGCGSATTQGGDCSDRHHHSPCSHHGCHYNAGQQCGQSHHSQCGSQDHHHHHHHQRSQRQHNADGTQHVFSHNHANVSVSGSSATSPSSSSSTSSFSTSSSSTCSSEASIDDEMFPRNRKQGLQCPSHSLSCTDISADRRDFEHDEEDEDTRPLLEDDHHHFKSNKSASLTSHKNTGGHKGTEKLRKAESSILFPAKGILKNQQGLERGAAGSSSFRKARSMESLPQQRERLRVSAGSGTWNRNTGKNTMDQMDLEKKREEARQTFVKQKMQFSAFLNEITRQVLSPLHLSSLGVTDTSRPCSPRQASSRSLQEQHRVGERKATELQRCLHSPGSDASSKHSHCAKRQYSHHHLLQQCHSGSKGSLQDWCHSPRCQDQGAHHDSSTSPETSPGLGLEHNRRCKQQQTGSGDRMTDGTSTSPELSPHLPRYDFHSSDHLQKPGQTQLQHTPEQHHSVAQHCAHQHAYKATNDEDILPSDHEQELHSRRHISSQRTTSPNPDVKQDKMSEVDRICSLHVPNTDVHQGVMQTAVQRDHLETELKRRYEQLEAELQRTRAELIRQKDKFKRLQESYSSTQQTNHFLEQKLHSVVQIMDEERERVSELTEQLSIAKTTVQTLETIHVPSHLQKAPKKHLQSDEESGHLLHVATPSVQPIHSSCVGNVSQPLDDPALDKGDSNWSKAEKKPQILGLKGSRQGQYGFIVFQPLKEDKDSCMEPVQVHKVGWSTESELENEGSSTQPLSCFLEIPHRQFIVHTETLPVYNTDTSFSHSSDLQETPKGGSIGSSAMCKLGSPVCILSASSDGLCPKRWQKSQGQEHPSSVTFKCTEAVLDLESPEEVAVKGSDEDEILSCWSKTKIKEKNGGDDSNTLLVSCQSGTSMLNQLIHHLHSTKSDVQSKGDVPRWAGITTEKVFSGQRTQL